MWNICGVMVFHRAIVKWSGETDYPQYMCILLYVKLISCKGIPHIYGQLDSGVYESSLYVHSAICDPYVV